MKVISRLATKTMADTVAKQTSSVNSTVSTAAVSTVQSAVQYSQHSSTASIAAGTAAEQTLYTAQQYRRTNERMNAHTRHKNDKMHNNKSVFFILSAVENYNSKQ